MPDYTLKGGKIGYSTKLPGTGGRGIPKTPAPSQAAKDHASRPKSKAIKDPKVGYGGSSDPKRND